MGEELPRSHSLGSLAAKTNNLPTERPLFFPQARRIITSMNKDELKKLLDSQFATFFGQMSRHIDQRFAQQDAGLDERLDRIETILDRRVKQEETDYQERVALKNQVDRHEGWIKQLAAKVGLRLSHE
jgi:DNA anti-recombination protein RmuC